MTWHCRSSEALPHWKKRCSRCAVEMRVFIKRLLFKEKTNVGRMSGNVFAGSVLTCRGMSGNVGDHVMLY